MLAGPILTTGETVARFESELAAFLGRRPGDVPIAERIGGETISLPFYPTMPEEYIVRVAATLRGIMAQGEEEKSHPQLKTDPKTIHRYLMAI